MSSLPTYVLITPARNEAQFIEGTIRSVVAQTVRPIMWAIISDGSVDSTDDIVLKYSSKYPWIQLLRMQEREERHFAGKVYAFNAGYKAVENLNYEVIVSLDADVTLDPEYFSFLLGKLAKDRSLGLVGTPFQEGLNPTYDFRYASLEHVSGACQVFRRECFEAIGGYTPVKGGCIDHIAVISCRMKGWKTRTFTEKVCQHHREMGRAQDGLLSARFKNGRKDYAIGNHPLWEVSRAAFQMTRKPVLVGGFALIFGYVWSAIARTQRPVSVELVAFYRREQMQRLKKILLRGSGQELTKPGENASVAS